MDTRAIVDELQRAYRAGDGERVAALVHDDIDWCIHGPDNVFSFEGPRRGKAQVMEVLATIGRQFEPKNYQLETVIVQGDRAAALIRSSFVQRSTGRTMNVHSPPSCGSPTAA